MARKLRHSHIAVLVLLGVFALGSGVRAQGWEVEVSRLRGASGILIEPETGCVLYEQNADLQRAPASIVKTMLELIVLERVASGQLRLDEPVTVSAWASRIGGSQVYLAQGEVFPLEDLLKAIVIASANDACAAVAEHVAGSTDGFVDLMNIRARELGLTNTHYVNVHGLDDEPGIGNVTTARDIAAIACHLVTMPHVLDWSSIVEAPFRNGTFKLQNTNKLLGHFPGLDGLKTGYTSKAGFCLCATAERKGLRLVSVVMGAESNKMRFQETARLLGAGFSQLRKETLIAAGAPIPGGVKVSGGAHDMLEAVAGAPLAVVLPQRAQAPTPVLIPLKNLHAPIARGDTVGTVEAQFAQGEIVRAPVVAAADMKRANVFQLIARMFGGGHS